jgi:hypothetical protein
LKDSIKSKSSKDDISDKFTELETRLKKQIEDSVIFYTSKELSDVKRTLRLQEKMIGELQGQIQQLLQMLKH